MFIKLGLQDVCRSTFINPFSYSACYVQTLCMYAEWSSKIFLNKIVYLTRWKLVDLGYTSHMHVHHFFFPKMESRHCKFFVGENIRCIQMDLLTTVYFLLVTATSFV